MKNEKGCDALEIAFEEKGGLDARLRDHVRTCGRCRGRVASLLIEEAALRRALRPAPAPDGLEARIVAALPRSRARALRRPARAAWAVAAAAAAAIIAAVLATRPRPEEVFPLRPAAPSSALRFDADARRLSLPDGSELSLSLGSDADFEPVPGTRGRVRLRQGELFALANPGTAPLLLEAPGLRARTNAARFVAAAEPIAMNRKETTEMNAPAATAAALLYVLSGSVAVEDGKPPVVARALDPECPRSGAPEFSCRSCHGANSELKPELLALKVRDVAIRVSADAPRGAIRGRVLDARGQPLEGASVRVRRTGAASWAVATDATGRFEVDGIEAGESVVSVSAPGFLESGETVASVAAGDTADVPPVTLEPERRISGRVVDRGGAPIAGAAVSVAPMLSPVRAGAALPSALGRVESLGIDPHRAQRARFRVLCPEEAGPHVTITAASLRIDSKDAVEFSFPFADTLLVADRHAFPGGRTDEDGRFDLGGVGDGPYFVMASSPGYVPAGDPISVSGGATDVVVVMAKGGEIRGTVFGPDGRPYAGARVNDAVTDADGSYRLLGLPAGEIDLFAGPADTNRILFVRYAAGSASLRGFELAEVKLHDAVRQSVQLRDGRIDVSPDETPETERPGIAVRRGIVASEGAVIPGIDFRLPVARVADGFVVDETGAPIGSARVRFEPGEEIRYFPASREAETDESGYFRMAGIYDVEGAVSAESPGHLPGEPVDAGPRSVVTGLRVVLPRGGELYGVASPGTRLVLADAEPGGGGGRRLNYPLEPEGEGPGEFRVRGVPPGRFSVSLEGEAGADGVDLGVFVIDPGARIDLGDLSLLLGPR